jgi:hypothetical protein
MGSSYSVTFRKKKKVYPLEKIITVKEKEEVVERKDIICVREGYNNTSLEKK